MSGKVDLTINQGANFTFEFQLLEEDANGDYVAVDLSEAVPAMQIRSSYRSDSVILDLRENGYIFITDAATGTVGIDIPAPATNQLSFTTAVYDAILIFNEDAGNERTIRLVEGRVTLSPGVTK